MRVKVRTEKKGVMKEFLSKIEVFFVKKRALYQYIRQGKKEKTDQKEVSRNFWH